MLFKSLCTIYVSMFPPIIWKKEKNLEIPHTSYSMLHVLVLNIYKTVQL